MKLQTTKLCILRNRLGFLALLASFFLAASAQEPIKAQNKQAAKEVKETPQKIRGIEKREKKLVASTEERIKELKEGSERVPKINLVEPTLSAQDRQIVLDPRIMKPGYAFQMKLEIRHRASVDVHSAMALYIEAIGGDTIYQAIIPRTKKEIEAKGKVIPKTTNKDAPKLRLHDKGRMQASVFLPWESRDRDYLVYDKAKKPNVLGIYRSSMKELKLLVRGDEVNDLLMGEIRVVDAKGKGIKDAYISVEGQILGKTKGNGRASFRLDRLRGAIEEPSGRSKSVSLYYTAYHPDYAPITKVLYWNYFAKKGSAKASALLAAKVMKVFLKPDEDSQTHFFGAHAPSREPLRLPPKRGQKGPGKAIAQIKWPNWAPKAWNHITLAATPFFFAEASKKLGIAIPRAGFKISGNRFISEHITNHHRAPALALSKTFKKPLLEALEEQSLLDWQEIFARGPNAHGGYFLRVPMIAGTYVMEGRKAGIRRGETKLEYFEFNITASNVKSPAKPNGPRLIVNFKKVDPLKRGYTIIEEDKDVDRRGGVKSSAWLRYYYPLTKERKGRASKNGTIESRPNAVEVKVLPWPKG